MASPLAQPKTPTSPSLTAVTDQEQRFGCRGNRKSLIKEPEVELVLSKMVAEGIPEMLRSHQVILWRIKVKEGKHGKKDRLKLEMDTTEQKNFDVKRFAEDLGRLVDMRVEIEERSINKCCHSACKSCLNYPARKEWVG